MKKKPKKLKVLNVILSKPDLSAQKIMEIVRLKMISQEDDSYPKAFKTLERISRQSISWDDPEKSRLEVLMLFKNYVRINWF